MIKELIFCALITFLLLFPFIKGACTPCVTIFPTMICCYMIIIVLVIIRPEYIGIFAILAGISAGILANIIIYAAVCFSDYKQTKNKSDMDEEKHEI